VRPHYEFGFGGGILVFWFLWLDMAIIWGSGVGKSLSCGAFGAV
jgi:hypothetical protein